MERTRPAVSDEEGTNWPQWRGPNQDGISCATGLPTTWGPEENILWKTALPSWSGATPIIWDDRIFVMSPSAVDPEAPAKFEQERRERAQQGQGRRRRFGGRGRHPGGDTLLLLCLSRTDGSILWQRELAQGNRLYMKGNNTSPSPVTDGEHVWTVTVTGQVTAFDMEGEQVWQRNLQEDYGSFGLNWPRSRACPPTSSAVGPARRTGRAHAHL